MPRTATASRKPARSPVKSLNQKEKVQQFWNSASCGEKGYALGDTEATQLNAQSAARYRLEPYLKPFAQFRKGEGKDVLEIGVGMGADHLEWAKHEPKSLTGIDLTERAINFTESRFKHAGLKSKLLVADAENLPFKDNSFDLVYSWGVLHHSPDTPKAFTEVCRVLRPGGTAKIMIYHTWSLTGLMLWARFGLLKGKPATSMAEIYAEYLESPGTKAYSKSQAVQLCRQAGFSACHVAIQLNHGDLLEGSVGQRHQGRLLEVVKKVWPRPLFKTVTPFLGLYLMIEAKK